MKGITGRGTIRFKGLINGHEVQILVDGGSSDNFIQPRVATFLQLPVQSTPNFRVIVGNGELLTCEGQVRDTPIHIQGHTLQISAYLLPIAVAELVLGTQWLATLDTHLVNYNQRFLTFFQDGAVITLQGETQPQFKQAQFHQFRRLQATDAIVELYTLQVEILDQPAQHLLQLPESIEPDMAVLLHTFKDVFDQPHGLPASRSHNHSIPLLPNTPSVKVRPYRYPHSQKSEIERIVTEMLAEGIVQRSSSPFSSLVLLVKKKDGTWRFCTDYKALNAVTVKDSFPMPTVDELLDELFGAQYFSKLDLRSGYHQILVKPEDRYKIAFRTHHGLYEWLVMPFGLTNAPATFQSLMNSVFATFLRKFVLVFFDDILVYSPDWNAHIQHLS